MKHIECVQNTEDWYRQRLGKPTASEFHRILKPTGGFSSQRYEYMYRLIYERIYRKRANVLKPTYWMERGLSLEPLAARACENYLGKPLKRVGLLLTDDGKFACSPDRIVDWNHAVEIKCPQPWLHIQYSVLGPQNDYYLQIHGLMYVGEFKRISFFSFCPGMPSVAHEIKRDETVMKMFAQMLPLFATEVDKHEKAARRLGEYSAHEVVVEPAIEWGE